MRKWQPGAVCVVRQPVMHRAKPLQRLGDLFLVALPLPSGRAQLSWDPTGASRPGSDQTHESTSEQGTRGSCHAGERTSRRTLLTMLGAGAATALLGSVGRPETGRAKNGKKSKSGGGHGNKGHKKRKRTRGQRTSRASSAHLVTSCVSAEAMEMLGLINAWRAANGVGSLALDGVLLAAAQTKSVTMAGAGVFAHDVAGVGPAQNMANHGAPIEVFSGENLAKGHQTVREVFTAWQASPDHNVNLLRAESVVLGVGVMRVQESQVVNGQFYPYATAYWTQVFASKVISPAAC